MCNAVARRRHQTCDMARWPDVKQTPGPMGTEQNLACGNCKVLVNNFGSTYGGLCSNYCRAIGRECVGAWEEQDDTCAVESIGEWDPGLIWFRI